MFSCPRRPLRRQLFATAALVLIATAAHAEPVAADDQSAGQAAPAAGAPATAAPSSAPPAPADAAAAAPGGGGADTGAYTVRLRSLEKNVNELKEQIFRTKARLNLLKETVLGGIIGASRAYIKHKNEMGSSFRLVKAAYALDGVQIYSKSDDTGRLAEMSDFEIYNGAIQPGSHTLTVVLLYQGNGFGVFSYLKGYKFTAKSSQSFVAAESKTTAITVVGYEKGNLTTQLSDKPAVDFRINVTGSGEGSATAVAPSK
ncbi:MAG TPA: hypothetical protein VMT47_03480 [Polyangia bacterium]|nr:hypothetical protein [Polyangia bacterium]